MTNSKPAAGVLTMLLFWAVQLLQRGHHLWLRPCQTGGREWQSVGSPDIIVHEYLTMSPSWVNSQVSVCGDSSPRCKLDSPSLLSIQPSHQDVMLALNVTANHKVNICTKFGMTRSHYMPVKTPFTWWGGGDGGGHIRSQQGCQTADCSLSHTIGCFKGYLGTYPAPQSCHKRKM